MEISSALDSNFVEKTVEKDEKTKSEDSKIENPPQNGEPPMKEKLKKVPTEKTVRKRKSARPTRSGSPRRTRSSDFYTSMVEEAIRLSNEEELNKNKPKKGKKKYFIFPYIPVT